MKSADTHLNEHIIEIVCKFLIIKKALLMKRTFLISLLKTFKNGHSVVILVSDQNTHDRLRVS
ncbi:hypothetical protein T06_16839 [Trichinella sp. T6]|nr:hypothetical protein T06_16839 [Trichinella sp. T6]